MNNNRRQLDLQFQQALHQRCDTVLTTFQQDIANLSKQTILTLILVYFCSMISLLLAMLNLYNISNVSLEFVLAPLVVNSLFIVVLKFMQR